MKARRIIASQGESEMLFFHLFFLLKKRTDIREWNVFSLWQNILAVIGIVIKLRYNAFRDTFEIVLVESGYGQDVRRLSSVSQFFFIIKR